MRAWFFVLLFAVIPMHAGSSGRPSLAVTQDRQSQDEIPDVRCGEILVRGSDQLTQIELCRLLDQASRNAATARLIDEYHWRGFLEVDLAWSNTENGGDSAAPAAVLNITEGAVYRLRRLEMVGNKNTRDNVIRRRVALDEGWPFDEELLALSIKRINQLGIFEEFRREDVGVKVNRKGHYVDLVFHLVEKQ